MKLKSFEIVIVEVPMRMSVEHSLATRKTARNVLLRAVADDGTEGWGESCPRSYVTGETVESVQTDLAGELLPPLIGKELQSLEATAAELTSVLDGLPRTKQAAFCALELAVLDLVGRARGVSAGDVIGPVSAEKARYSGVLATEDVEELQRRAPLLRKFGVAEVKVKVGASLENNLALLESAREILGGEVRLRIDANAAWDAAESIRQLEAMKPFHLEGVEQPVPGDDLEGMKAVTAAKLVPVVADESLCSLAEARTLAAEGGCDVFNVRISKCGGLANAARIAGVARDAGLTSQLGAQVGETGILSAAGRHFATRCAPIWSEGSYGGLLLESDITDPDVTVGPGGFAPALTAPGLGVVPIAERVSAFESSRQTVA